jgi:hypothetical protein
MICRRSLVFVAAAGLLFAGSARADLPPPEDVEVCSTRKVGDACEAEGESGKCVTHSCSRLDYSGGVPPESVTYDCLRCDTSGAAASPGPKPAPKPEGTTPQPSDPTPAPEVVETPAEKSSDAVPVESKGACSVARGSAPGSLALILLALVRRRRRR